MHNSAALTQLFEQQPEMLVRICDELDDPALLALARSCKSLHQTVSQFYLKANYGKMSAFLDFAYKGLDDMKKSIATYQKANIHSFFSTRGRNSCQKLFTIINTCIQFILILYIMAKYLLKIMNGQSVGSFLYPTASFILLLGYNRLAKCGEESYNGRLLWNTSLDQQAGEDLQQLLQNYPLLNTLYEDRIMIYKRIPAIRVGLGLVGELLNELIEKVAAALEAFDDYRNRSRGLPLESVELFKITHQDNRQDKQESGDVTIDFEGIQTEKILNSLIRTYNRTCDNQQTLTVRCSR